LAALSNQQQSGHFFETLLLDELFINKGIHTDLGMDTGKGQHTGKGTEQELGMVLVMQQRLPRPL
jgi:hypothetical protein